MWRTVVDVHSLGCPSAYVHIGPSREAFFDCQRLMSDALIGGAKNPGMISRASPLYCTFHHDAQ
jgi:hypothetical protein